MGRAVAFGGTGEHGAADLDPVVEELLNLIGYGGGVLGRYPEKGERRADMKLAFGIRLLLQYDHPL